MDTRMWISKDEFAMRMTINLREECGDSELSDMKDDEDNDSNRGVLLFIRDILLIVQLWEL